jgi:hypothetical protein
MYLCIRFSAVFVAEKILKGEVTEWFKVHAWKVCVLQKGTAGSNPAFSAKTFRCPVIRGIFGFQKSGSALAG